MAQMGWIQLSRKLLDCYIWDDKPFNRGAAWVDLLLLANHADKKVVIDSKVVVVGRGQRWTSYRVLGERWGWSLEKVKHFLEVLISDNMITMQKTKHGTLLSIVNYDKYQDTQNTDRTQTEHKPNADRTQSEHEPNTDRTQTEQNKNDKNDKNDENEKNENNITPLNPPKEKPKSTKQVYFPNDEVLEQTFQDFILMRNRIRKPMTDRAIKNMLAKLERLSTDADEQVKIFEQSIMNCWTDIYPLKSDSGRGNKDSIVDRWANIH